MKRELTKQLESATRKRIDENLKNLNWRIDEFKKDCNVYTGRTRTKEETSKIKAIFPKGKYPDYVLYSSDDYKPIAIIEAKRTYPQSLCHYELENASIFSCSSLNSFGVRFLSELCGLS
jgi:type I site-specific restriction endonuclease